MSYGATGMSCFTACAKQAHLMMSESSSKSIMFDEAPSAAEARTTDMRDETCMRGFAG